MTHRLDLSAQQLASLAVAPDIDVETETNTDNDVLFLPV